MVGRRKNVGPENVPDLRLITWLFALGTRHTYLTAAQLRLANHNNGQLPGCAHTREFGDRQSAKRGRLRIVCWHGVVSPVMYFPSRARTAAEVDKKDPPENSGIDDLSHAVVGPALSDTNNCLYDRSKMHSGPAKSCKFSNLPKLLHYRLALTVKPIDMHDRGCSCGIVAPPSSSGVPQALLKSF